MGINMKYLGFVFGLIFSSPLIAQEKAVKTYDSGIELATAIHKLNATYRGHAHHESKFEEKYKTELERIRQSIKSVKFPEKISLKYADIELFMDTNKIIALDESSYYIESELDALLKKSSVKIANLRKKDYQAIRFALSDPVAFSKIKQAFQRDRKAASIELNLRLA